jgi:hypothetical protein
MWPEEHLTAICAQRVVATASTTHHDLPLYEHANITIQQAWCETQGLNRLAAEHQHSHSHIRR